jgi:hypothetical protein
MRLKNKNINENQNFLDRKFIMFDDEATKSDIIKTYKILTSMGVKPLSVIMGPNTTEGWIYKYIDEIEDFIDLYGGAYFRMWVTTASKELALDYGAIDEFDIDSVEDSRLIYFKDLLDTSDIDFFPENINESGYENDNKYYKPKVGDYLYCHQPVVMEYNGDVEATKGRLYKIEEIRLDNSLRITNDSNTAHYFSLNKKDSSYYEKWFSLSLDVDTDTFFEPLD